MPNWVSNHLRITGEPAKVAKVLEAFKGADTCLDFNKLVPIDESEPKYQAKVWEQAREGGSPRRYTDEHICADDMTPVESTECKEDGDRLVGYVFNWYKAHCECWGTKWEACDPALEYDGGDTAVIHFDTAWSSPDKVLAVLGQFTTGEYAGVELAYYCTEESNAFMGHGTGSEGEFNVEFSDPSTVCTAEKKTEAILEYMNSNGVDPEKYDMDKLLENSYFHVETNDFCFESLDNIELEAWDVDLDDCLKEVAD